MNEYQKALDTMCKRCMNHEMCQGTGCQPKKDLQELVDRATPKKPNIWGDGYADGELVYDMFDCPNCGESYEIDYEMLKYCPECGQHIDWSDWND